MFGRLRNKLKSFLGKKEESQPIEQDEEKEETEEKLVEPPIKKQIETKEKPAPVKVKAPAPQVKPKVKETPKEPSVKPKELPKKEPKKIEEPEQQEKILTGTKPTTSKEKSFFKRIFKKKEEPAIPLKPKITEPPTLPKEIPQEQGLLQKFSNTISSSTPLTKEKVNEILEPLEFILLENNVALETVDQIKSKISKELVGTTIKKDKIESTITDSLKNAIQSVLIEPSDLIQNIKDKSGTYTIIFFGINGSGKTTSIAKLAHKLKTNNITCILAAADTFRAASIEQLEIHAKRLEIPMIKHDYGSDPTAVAFDAKKYAEKNNIKCVLIDTAGRMYTKENLIKQMEKIIRVIQPDLKIFVGESITGNDATQQAKTFHEAVGIDGIVLSKADVDEKGGTALSVSQVTGKPIFFLGVGQNYDDLQEFKKSNIMKNLGLD